MALKGSVDILSAIRVDGWVWDAEAPDERVSLIVTADDVLVGRVLANRYRADLEQAGIGDGRHAFSLSFDDPLMGLARCEIRIRRERDGADIPGSPGFLEPPRAFDDDARRTISQALAKCGGREDTNPKIDFLVEQIDRLMDFPLGQADRRHQDFIKRWLLSKASAVGETQAPARRALVIDDEAPSPSRDAGSVAILSHIESLMRLGFEVAFVPSRAFREPPAPDSTAALGRLGVFCFQPPYYGSVEDVMVRRAGEFDLVYLHRFRNAAQYCELARAYFPKARVLYSIADLHSLRLARQAAVENSPELKRLSEATRRREAVAMALADAVVTHSEFEAELIRRAIRPERVHVAPWVQRSRPVLTPSTQRRGMAFVGFYRHKPNLDAARWLITDILPRIRNQDPDFECWLVGHDLPRDLVDLCGAGCVALGPIDDLAQIFERVRLTIAPLAYGAGIKGKVLESLAAGLPCICTSIAAEGLDLPAPLRRLIADDAEGLASIVRRLHDSADEIDVCARAGLAFVAERFSAKEVDAALARAAAIERER